MLQLNCILFSYIWLKQRCSVLLQIAMPVWKKQKHSLFQFLHPQGARIIRIKFVERAAYYIMAGLCGVRRLLDLKLNL